MIAVHIFKPSSPSLTGAIYTGGRAIAVTHSVWFSETDVASVYDSPAVHGLRHEPETESNRAQSAYSVGNTPFVATRDGDPEPRGAGERPTCRSNYNR